MAKKLMLQVTLASEERVVVLNSLSEMCVLEQVNSYCVSSFTTELSGC